MDVLAFSAIVIVMMIREYAHHRQETRSHALISELTDKLKASSFTEYVEAKQETKTFEPVANDDEELYWKEIEANKV